jgi:predicted transglutaminase-like cysteine proteinase
MDERHWRELQEANTLANHMIEPLSDSDQHSRAEVWTIPGLFGDCEDYVLLKRKWLMEKGWPSGSLLISVVYDEVGEGHAVLVARSSAGDLVLDNKTDEIRLWSETPYRFVKRQSVSDPQRWVRVGPPNGQEVTSAAPSGPGKSWLRLLRGGLSN